MPALKGVRGVADAPGMGGIRRFRRRRGQGGQPLLPGATPQDITDTVSSVMLDAGLPLAYMHAWETCGFMVTEDNYGTWTEDELWEWEFALEEGEDIYGPLPD